MTVYVFTSVLFAEQPRSAGCYQSIGQQTVHSDKERPSTSAKNEVGLFICNFVIARQWALRFYVHVTER